MCCMIEVVGVIEGFCHNSGESDGRCFAVRNEDGRLEFAVVKFERGRRLGLLGGSGGFS